MSKGRWLTIKEVAAQFGFNRRTLYRWRSEKTGPPYFRLGGAVRYREDELNAWIEAQRGQ